MDAQELERMVQVGPTGLLGVEVSIPPFPRADWGTPRPREEAQFSPDETENLCRPLTRAKGDGGAGRQAKRRGSDVPTSNATADLT